MFGRTRAELLSVAILPFGLGLAVYGAPAPETSPDQAPVAAAHGPASFASQVLPIFVEHCSDCHGEETQEVELNLTTYEAVMKGSEYGSVIEAGNPDASLLIEMVVAGEMPQESDPVPPEQIALIRSWIAAGAENN